MPTPDEAATIDHDQLPVARLTPADEGAVIEVAAFHPVFGKTTVTGRIVSVTPEQVRVREEGRALDTTVFRAFGEQTYRVLEPAPSANGEPMITPVDTAILRELISVSDQLTMAEGDVKSLKARKEKLSAMLVEQFAANGINKLSIDNRTTYLHTSTGARFLDRPADEGGGKYTAEDLVPVLRRIGRPEYVKPETTNWQTISSLLREYRANEEEVPPELAAMVVLRGEPEIRVRTPKAQKA